MITLITGTPGSGKTLYAVTKMLDEIKSKPERPIYSDIIGLNVEGIFPAPDDWRKAEKGALIIYDEVQFREAYQRARGKTRFDFILQLTTHRHDGYDIWIITQSSKFIHLDVIEVVAVIFTLIGLMVLPLLMYSSGKPHSLTQKAAPLKILYALKPCLNTTKAYLNTIQALMLTIKPQIIKSLKYHLANTSGF